MNCLELVLACLSGGCVWFISLLTQPDSERLDVLCGGCGVQTPAQAEYPEYLQWLKPHSISGHSAPMFTHPFFSFIWMELRFLKFIQDFFCRNPTSVPLFLKKQWDVLCKQNTRERDLAGAQIQGCIRYFYFHQLYCAGWCFLICFGIFGSASKSVLINSSIQNNRRNLIPDGWETKFSWGQNLTEDGGICSRNCTFYSLCHSHQF